MDYAVSLSRTPAPALRPSALRAPELTICPPAREVPAGGSGAPALSLERLPFFSEPRLLEAPSPRLHCSDDGLQASSSFRHLARHARRHPAGTCRETTPSASSSRSCSVIIRSVAFGASRHGPLKRFRRQECDKRGSASSARGSVERAETEFGRLEVADFGNHDKAPVAARPPHASNRRHRAPTRPSRQPDTFRMGIRERLNARHAGTGQCSQATGNATFDVPELARKTPSACPHRVARIPNQDERTHAQ